METRKEVRISQLEEEKEEKIKKKERMWKNRYQSGKRLNTKSQRAKKKKWEKSKNNKDEEVSLRERRLLKLGGSESGRRRKLYTGERVKGGRS